MGSYAPKREAHPSDRYVGDREIERHPRVVARGYKAVDTDDGWSEPQPDGRQLWREDAIQALLTTEDADVLFVAGCEENQGKFLPRFDQVVLLSAPVETLVERLATRTNNTYGKAPEELRRFLEDVQNVEPLPRRVANHEVQTTVPQRGGGDDSASR